MNDPAVMRAMLTNAKTIAVVGLSDNPIKPSYGVSRYMQRAGYRIIPVNPTIEAALGEKAYPSLSELPFKPDLVNVFRLPKAIPTIVDEMIALDLKAIWVQLGIRNEEAKLKAEAAGIDVVMDRCIMIDHSRMGLG